MKQAVSAVFFKNWRRRWITLLPHGIEWRASQFEPPKGFLPVGPLTSVSCWTNTPNIAHPGRYNCVCVRSAERELVLQCPNEFETRAWKEAIDGAIQTASGSAHASLIQAAQPPTAVAMAQGAPVAVAQPIATPITQAVPQATAAMPMAIGAGMMPVAMPVGEQVQQAAPVQQHQGGLYPSIS